MEPNTPAPDGGGLPPGVSNPAPAPAPVAAAPPAPMPAPAPAIPPPEKWNWLIIGGGILLTTVGFFAIYFYRYKTRQYAESVTDQETKISSIERRLNEIYDNAA